MAADASSAVVRGERPSPVPWPVVVVAGARSRERSARAAPRPVPEEGPGRGLPPPTDHFTRFFAGAPVVDWSAPESVIDHRVQYALMLAGSEQPLEEAQVRELVRGDVGACP